MLTIQQWAKTNEACALLGQTDSKLWNKYIHDIVMRLLRKQCDSSIMVTWYERQVTTLDRMDRKNVFKEVTPELRPEWQEGNSQWKVLKELEEHSFQREPQNRSPDRRNSGRSKRVWGWDTKLELDMLDLQCQADAQMYLCASQPTCKVRIIRVPHFIDRKTKVQEGYSGRRGRIEVWSHVLGCQVQHYPSCPRL